MAKRLKPHKERTVLESLKFRAKQAIYSPKDFQNDIFHKIAANEKPIKRFLIKLLILSAIIFALAILACLFFSVFTIYINGEPVLGPGAN